MINKLAKAQKSWIAKLILTLTALSFMSLFGITGYISNASNNRTVISVDNMKVSQAAFAYEFQKELNAAKNLLNIDLNDELNEEIRSAVTNSVSQKMLKDAIIDRTAQKHHVSFRQGLIQQIIMNEPSFHDMSGNFNKDLFRRVLSENNISESEYVKAVERGLAEQILVRWPVQNITVPSALVKAESKIDNKRRTFKYVLIKPADITIDRQMTQDELEQYYEDFSAQFIAPEMRDLSVLYIPVADIAQNMKIADEDIKSYYQEHIDNYETPEKRHILQMMFETQEAALKAFEKLQSGVSFEQVALENANQTKEETDLGYASQDELVVELAEDVFSLNKGEYTNPLQVGDVWQIMQVTDIQPASKKDYRIVSEEIKQELIADQLYDEIYKISGKMEDSLGAGKSLEEISSEFGGSVVKVLGLTDTATATHIPSKLTALLTSADFIDTAFSYAAGETSQTIESDDGLAILRVDRIEETHQKDIKEVSSEIKELWQNNEKAALAQETLNDILHDVENGDDLYKAAPRYGLHVYKSQPITRNESFADLDYSAIKELFMQDLGQPYQTSIGENYIIAVPSQDYQDTSPLSDSEQNLVTLKTKQGLQRDLEKAMLDSYAKDYKIKVKYKLMGIIE